MSFIVRNLTGSAIAIDDLGLTIPASADLDITSEQPQDVALSDDLVAAIQANSVAVLDPLDGTTPLNAARSEEIVRVHNDPHYRIRGGTLDQLEDVDLTGAAQDFVLQQNGAGTFVPVSPSSLASNINLDDLGDVDDATPHTLDTIYVFKGDGTNLDVVDATADPEFGEVIEDIIGAAFQNGTDTTFVYDDGNGTLQVDVDDVFLRNTGDTLDSGTLTIASGAAINVATGGTLTIQDDPVNPKDAANKEYVDSVASGLDPKESVRVATTPVGGDIGGTYNSAGGTGGTGNFTGVDLTSDAIFDGVPSGVGALQVGDRILIKNQTDSTQNGIYVVTVAGAAGSIERAPDHDASPSNEVSGGNFTFVENGTVNAGTGWVLQGDGEQTLNTDPITWAQFSESTTLNAGEGLSQSGSTIDLDIDDLTVASIVDTDFLAFHDGNGAAQPSGSQTYKITAADFIADLGILTGGPGGALTASDGVLITAGNDIQLDITSLANTPVTAADELVFDDGASGSHIKRTAGDFLNDLDVVRNLGGNGIAVQTAPDTYTARSIAVDGLGNLDGLAVTNGDGVAGNPTLGLDIQNLPIQTGISTVDRVAVYDVTADANVYYTVGDIAGALANVNSFETWSAAGNTTGDASIVADDATDTVTLTGGTGINIDFNSASDTLVFDFDVALLTAGTGPLTLSDQIVVLDGTDNLRFTLQDLVDDLDIVNGIAADGILVRTAADTYASRTIEASAAAGEEGLTVTNGDGVAGNPTVGLDIDNLADSADDLAATDELVAFDGTNNVSMSGQQVADGVSTILGLGGLTVTTIGGQEVLTLEDTTRANKVLSIETTPVVWSENRITNNDWMSIGNAVDADSGYVLPLNATIVKVSMHTADDNNNSKGIDLYIDGVNNGNIAAFTAVNGENEVTDVTLNIDVNAGQKIRLRGDAAGGVIEDTVVTVWLKWRG
jgi:hypothetical protein